MTYGMFLEETLSQAGKKQQIIAIKSFTQTYLMVLNIKKLHK